MNRTASLQVMLLAILLLPGCYAAEKQKLLTEEFRTQPVTVPFSLGRVDVTDARSGVESRGLVIVSESQKRSDSVQPTLTAAHKQQIQSELARYFSEGQPPVSVNAEMLSGKQLFEANATRAKETSEVEMKLTFVDGGGRTLSTVWGKAKPEVESPTASQAYSDALFNRAIQMSLYSAMRRAQAELATVPIE